MQSLNTERAPQKSLLSNSSEYEIKENKFIVNDDEEEENNIFIYNKKRQRKIFKYPFIIYIVFFTIFSFINSLIALIVCKTKYKQNYSFIQDIYIKPHISEHNYSKIIFDNNLEIVLTQVHYNDTAGGALSFENGYLDLIYNPGLLKLAFLSMNQNDRESISEINDYMGDLLQSIEEFYSTLYFTILNSGLEKFLKNFKEYTLYDNDNTTFTRLVNNNLQRRFNSTSPSFNSIDEREKYLVEYLVYNIKDKNGNDINRQSSSDEVNKTLNGNYKIIADIMEQLFNTKKMKLILFSHYKMSLMKKFILRYLHELIVHESPKEINYPQYEKIITNKIIYHQIKENDNNYIKINYYVNNSKVNLSQLYIDSGYFNYLKYVLDETNNESLYYNLTTNNEGINIKSLSCDFEVVLKNRIRFSILISLNSNSYTNIKRIIEIVYDYMEKIKAHIKNLKPEDNRVKELYKINQQNFSFTEDIHLGEF